MMALVLVLFYAALLEFIRSYLRNFRNKPAVGFGETLPSVSVIVPFRNEKATLPELVRMLLSQHYKGPKPEIILVNDHSTDGSGEMEFPVGVRLIHLVGEQQGKKAALTAGIESAKGKWIVTTDADVIVSPDWLYALLKQADDYSAQMICGSVEIQSDGSFLQDFQLMETRVLQGCGIAAMEAGTPLLNTGASLAFRKDAWLAVRGYSAHEHIPSGDDVFLLFDMHKSFPAGIEYASHPAAIVFTKPVKSFRDVILQRIRWVSKMKYYRSVPVFLIAFIVLVRAFAVLAALVSGSWFLLLILLGVGGLAELRLLKAASFHVKTVSVFNRLLMVIFYPFYLLILTIGAIVYKPDWKGH